MRIFSNMKIYHMNKFFLRDDSTTKYLINVKYLNIKSSLV